MRRRGAYVVLCCVALLWVALLASHHLTGRAGVVERLEYQLLDLRYKLIGPVKAAPDLAIVAIDDATLAAVASGGLSRRAMLATLIENIAESDAAGLALDVLLVDEGGAREDARLAAALAALPSTIAGAATFSGVDTAQINLIWPHPRFQETADVGVVNMATDANGLPRYAPLMIEVEGELLPSLPLLAAMSVADETAQLDAQGLRVGSRYVPLDSGFYLPLRLLGPEGTVPTQTATDLLAGPAPETLSGKLVVLGFSAAATGDRFATPFGPSVPGMEVIATAISQLAGGISLRLDGTTRIWDVLHAASLTVLGLLVIGVWSPSRSVPAAIGCLGLSFVVSAAAFASGLWLNAALPLLCALPPMMLMGGLRYANERSEAARTRRSANALRRFQSPVLAERIENDPDYLAAPQQQRLVILFADLTGFTTLSQQLGPGGTRDLLRLFHETSATTIEAQGGSVFNYMGDGVMAVFGLDPDASVRPADQALQATFDLVTGLSQYDYRDLPDTVLRCRVGLHSGDVTLSRLGADSHQQVTVTGDTVNVASRLMEVAKSEGAAVTASRVFCVGLSDDSLFGHARETAVVIRGRDGEEIVHVWTEEALTAAYT
ncbi:MAG: CHASE2 domain-containing protein [Roseobacter sp.]